MTETLEKFSVEQLEAAIKARKLKEQMKLLPKFQTDIDWRSVQQKAILMLLEADDNEASFSSLEFGRFAMMSMFEPTEIEPWLEDQHDDYDDDFFEPESANELDSFFDDLSSIEDIDQNDIENDFLDDDGDYEDDIYEDDELEDI